MRRLISTRRAPRILRDHDSRGHCPPPPGTPCSHRPRQHRARRGGARGGGRRRADHDDVGGGATRRRDARALLPRLQSRRAPRARRHVGAPADRGAGSRRVGRVAAAPSRARCAPVPLQDPGLVNTTPITAHGLVDVPLVEGALRRLVAAGFSPKEALLAFDDVVATAIDSVRRDYCINREAANGNTQLSLFRAALRDFTRDEAPLMWQLADRFAEVPDNVEIRPRRVVRAPHPRARRRAPRVARGSHHPARASALTVALRRLPRQPQHALAEHVVLDLVRPAVDRVGAAEQEQLLLERELVRAASRRSTLARRADRRRGCRARGATCPRTASRSTPRARARRVPTCCASRSIASAAARSTRRRAADARADRRSRHRARASAKTWSSSRSKPTCCASVDTPRSKPSSAIATRQPSPTSPTTRSAPVRGAVEEDLVELAAAGDLHDRADLDTGLVHRHEQERQPGVASRRRIGARDHEAPVGHVRERGPDLLAGEHPLVTVEHRPGLHRGEVRAGVGLAVALAPSLLAAAGSEEGTAPAARASRTR